MLKNWRSNYIPVQLKNEILLELRKYKLLNGEVSFLDPVYLAVDIAAKLNVVEDDLEMYGKHKAKLELKLIDENAKWIKKIRDRSDFSLK